MASHRMVAVIEIPLTRGLVALVDDGDALAMGAYSWHAHPDTRTWYASRTIRYPDGSHSTQQMHALITGLTMVDHRNGNGLDNRRSNLRAATQSQNMMNIRKFADTSSRFKGVNWDRDRECWRAQIRVSGRNRSLGRFTDEVKAALAYDCAARINFGEFAALNFPEQAERSALGTASLLRSRPGRRKRASAP